MAILFSLLLHDPLLTPHGRGGAVNGGNSSLSSLLITTSRFEISEVSAELISKFAKTESSFTMMPWIRPTNIPTQVSQHCLVDDGISCVMPMQLDFLRNFHHSIVVIP